jgi:2-haloacid dehalogenase
MTPKAVIFDAYGTLFDVHSVALRAEQLFAGRGQALSQHWRDKQIELSRLCSMSGLTGAHGPAVPGLPGASAALASHPVANPAVHPAPHYRPFWELTRAALRWAAARLDLVLDASAEDALMNEYRHLSAFPENREVLAALRQRGVPAGILSNGDPEMLAVAVRSAGFAPLLQHVLSAHAVRRFKTDPAVYALGPTAFGLPAREILFVSSNGWDALGATWYGYTTLWVNRAGAPPEPLPPEPTRTARNLRAVLDFFPD